MSAEYLLTVGLEVHAELKTRTKMFCDSKNDPDETRPNVNVCPICMGYPGTLPVINKEAVKHVLRLGVAVGGELADFAEFDRKNYFYPDIPKGYQISQYKHPLVRGGELAGVKLTRIHLEEDTARSAHDKGDDSLLDFNRAGVPLMELVTEPVIHTAEDAAQFARELQLVLTYLGIAEANMEKGEMRLEANISVAKVGMGTKVEVKNLNSFKSVERAIKFEYARQVALIEAGQIVVQETRGWDEDRGETFSQRLKEESHDYRYFPDPDLPKLILSEVEEFAEDALRATLPELPDTKRSRLTALGLSAEHVENYVRDSEKGRYFDEVSELVESNDSLRLASNFINTDLKSYVDPNSLAEVVRMTEAGEISSRAAKDILKIIETEGGVPKTIASDRGLLQLSDKSALLEIARTVKSAHPDAPLQFLVGQAMKESKGSANPVVLKEIFETEFKS